MYKLTIILSSLQVSMFGLIFTNLANIFRQHLGSLIFSASGFGIGVAVTCGDSPLSILIVESSGAGCVGPLKLR